MTAATLATPAQRAASMARRIAAAVRARLGLWLAVTLGFTLGFYLMQLLGLVLRFGKLPNYVTLYDWPANIATIIESTPAVSDMLPIIADEWLIEIGHMNYDYGHGIAEWSLAVMPAKALLILALGALIATNLVLLRPARGSCPGGGRQAAGAAATGAGTLLAGLTSLTMTWVVCCATPSWVVGLAMLGLGVSTSLWLEPVGPWLSAVGFVLLTATALWLARERTPAAATAAHPAAAARPLQQ